MTLESRIELANSLAASAADPKLSGEARKAAMDLANMHYAAVTAQCAMVQVEALTILLERGQGRKWF